MINWRWKLEVGTDATRSLYPLDLDPREENPVDDVD
jgi:hypothetical protein